MLELEMTWKGPNRLNSVKCQKRFLILDKRLGFIFTCEVSLYFNLTWFKDWGWCEDHCKYRIGTKAYAQNVLASSLQETKLRNHIHFVST